MPEQCTITELTKIILADTKATTSDKVKLLNEIRKLRTGEEDRWLHRAVVWILGAVAIAVALYPLFTFLKAGSPPEWKSLSPPEGILALAASAIGALAAFLTPSLRRNGDSSSAASDKNTQVPQGGETQVPQGGETQVPQGGKS